MRKILMLAAALVACAKADKPVTDTAAVASAPAMAPAPAPLTAAQTAGTWSGITMGETSDSVTARFTAVSADGVTGTITIEGTKTTIPYTVTYSGDSMVTASNAPFTSPYPGLPKLNFRSVSRMQDGKLVGTITNTLGSKPDSVVMRARWVGTKVP